VQNTRALSLLVIFLSGYRSLLFDITCPQKKTNNVNSKKHIKLRYIRVGNLLVILLPLITLQMFFEHQHCLMKTSEKNFLLKLSNKYFLTIKFVTSQFWFLKNQIAAEQQLQHMIVVK